MGWATLRRSGVLFALGVLLGLTECTSPARSSPRQDYCQTDCEGWTWCLNLGSAQIDPCVNNCLVHPFTRNMRGEVLTDYAACLDDLQCAMFTDDAARNECFLEAFHQAPHSKVCAEFCEGHVLKSFECGYRFSMDDCARYNCGVIDDVLLLATECAERDSCESWDSCLQGAFSLE